MCYHCAAIESTKEFDTSSRVLTLGEGEFICVKNSNYRTLISQLIQL